MVRYYFGAKAIKLGLEPLHSFVCQLMFCPFVVALALKFELLIGSVFGFFVFFCQLLIVQTMS